MLDVTGEGVQIGMPVLGDLPDEGFYSLIGLQKPKGSKLTKVTQMPVDIARDEIVNKLERNWLFFMDADETIPSETLMRLLSWNLPIISGIVFLASLEKPTPAIYRYQSRRQGTHYYTSRVWEVEAYLKKHKDELGETSERPDLILPAEREDLIECDAVGSGCLLVHRSVFEATKPPYFKHNKGIVSGEDFYFCRKAKRAGFKIYADPGVLCGHRTRNFIGYQYFRNWLKYEEQESK